MLQMWNLRRRETELLTLCQQYQAVVAADSSGREGTQPEVTKDTPYDSSMQQGLGALWKAVTAVQGSGFQTVPQSFGVSPRVRAEGEDCVRVLILLPSTPHSPF